jgi:RNA polymerase subunit RPABC4/transcription elongation factor Spt4
MEDRCVFCGIVVPEGRHVCPACFEERSGGLQEAEKAQRDLIVALDHLTAALIEASATLRAFQKMSKKGTRKNGD